MDVEWSNDSYTFLALSAAVYAVNFALDAVRDALTASRTSSTAPTADVASDDCHDKSDIKKEMRNHQSGEKKTSMKNFACARSMSTDHLT